MAASGAGARGRTIDRSVLSPDEASAVDLYLESYTRVQAGEPDEDVWSEDVYP